MTGLGERERTQRRGVRERESKLTLILIATIRSIWRDLQRRELFRGQQSAH